MSKIRDLSYRVKINKYTKMKEKPEEARHLVKYKNEKLYDYYICDYCGQEIKILDKKDEMSGGKTIIPHTITKNGDVIVALHNRCLKPFLKMIEEEDGKWAKRIYIF